MTLTFAVSILSKYYDIKIVDLFEKEKTDILNFTEGLIILN